MGNKLGLGFAFVVAAADVALIVGLLVLGGPVAVLLFVWPLAMIMVGACNRLVTGAWTGNMARPETWNMEKYDVHVANPPLGETIPGSTFVTRYTGNRSKATGLAHFQRKAERVRAERQARSDARIAAAQAELDARIADENAKLARYDNARLARQQDRPTLLPEESSPVVPTDGGPTDRPRTALRPRYRRR
jgi:hypothetical protein